MQLIYFPLDAFLDAAASLVCIAAATRTRSQ
jgi:hypothetical protein